MKKVILKKNNKKPAAKSAAGKKSKKAPPKRKNVSQKVPNGRTLQTRDEYFEGQGKYRKPGYEGKGMYRKVVVVDSNRKDELAVVKLTTSNKGKSLPNYQKGESKFRPYITTKDDEGAPIKLGRKFLQNSKKKDVSKKDIDKIKKSSINKNGNRKRLRILKNRK